MVAKIRTGIFDVTNKSRSLLESRFNKDEIKLTIESDLSQSVSELS